MDEPADPIQHKRLVHGARFRALPLNVECPARCAFCYDKSVPKLLPHVRTVHVPPYDEAQFDAFRQMHARACEWERETDREPAYSILPSFDHTPEGIRHFPNCDIFSSGLTHEQIEEFVRMREGDTCLLYAVGLNIDPDFIAYLTAKYPDTFRLHLSIVTFDREIRRRLMHPDIDVEVLRQVCGLTKQATFFLLLFAADQLVADVEELLELTSADSGGLFVQQLYADRCSPKRVVRYAAAARGQRENAIRRIRALSIDGRSVMFSLGADIQAFTRRREIEQLLAPCTGADGEVIFCSPGAFAVVDHIFAAARNRVVAMECVFGGNLDLVHGCTARGVVRQVEELRAAGKTVRRVVVPDAVFWIDGKYDLNGERLDELAESLGDVQVEVIAVPGLVLWSVVDLQDCLSFFDDPRRETFDNERRQGGGEPR